MRDLIKSSLAAVCDRKLLILHVVLNAALGAAGAFWLLVPDEHGWQILATVLSALAVLLLAVWLHAGTLAYCAHGRVRQRSGVPRALLQGLAFLIVVAVLFWLADRVATWAGYSQQISGYLYSKMPSFRRTLTYNRLNEWFDCGFLVLQLYVVPALLLPLAAAGAAYGFSRKLVRGLCALGCWKYWLWLAVLVLLGVEVPRLLIDWKPTGTLHFETTSMVLRLLGAYLLMVLCWLAACGMLGKLVAERVESTGNAGGKTAS